ncbi:hypothetical protein ABMA27_015740 [Loxostege sticticalis]|uniref:Major facilitator superfamily (MFS) profile domain-containing protein n=1 Tax=Loxostege sticticalis TaxID=481309 RepID=A0ABR3I456_LOXSC
MAKVKNIKFNNPIEKHFDKITRYHVYFFFLIFLSKLPVFWHVLNLIFLSPPIDYHCISGGFVGNTTKNECPCIEPEWDRSVFLETMQTKFNLICDKKWLVSFSQSMSYVGTLIGSLLFGVLSDKFGRLSAFTLSCLILAISGCLVSVMPEPSLYTTMRTIEGIGVGGAIVTAYVLCVEFCGLRHRESVTALFHIPINISHVSLAGVSYALRHCDEFQLVLSIPVFLFVGMKWLVMESPKWLMDNNHVDKAVAVMERIAKFNGVSSGAIREEIEAYHASHAQNHQTKLKFWQIFKHRKPTMNLGCMSVVFFVCGMGYYGVSQYIGLMSGNIHINVAISGTLLIPGTITAFFLLKILKRRTFLMATMFLSGITMITVICIPAHMNFCRVVVACICNCFFFISFIIVFLFGVELFPTTIRNSVLGFLSFISRVGQIVAPQINSLPATASGGIFGAMAIIGSLLCYPLPETKNTELPSSLEDTKNFTRRLTDLTIEEDTSQAAK